jgi:single-stranded-DNA-specific exonuclease
MSNRAVEDIVAKILTDRGIPKSEQATFIQPDFERDTHSPWLLPGMTVAVERLCRAHEKNDSVIVFGDYDADGVPATALLLRVCKRLGFAQVEGVIPTRTQGYGLTAAVVEELIARKPKVVVTVDNGTVAREEVKTLTEAGIDVIVVDHHEPQEGKVAEEALAIINPKMEGSMYPFQELCACALAWKLGCALAEKLYGDVVGLKWELDLVGLSTIADMVPLVGENRVLAQYGLKVLRKTKNLGLQALIEVAGVKIEQLSAGDVGFKIAPRINAPSRMHNELLNGEHSALRLLVAEDISEAREIAQHLNTQNNERQRLVDTHLAQAREQVG